jgi:signal transduction histidine kinase
MTGPTQAVLVVDDEPDIRKLMTWYVQHQQKAVVAVGSGHEALRQLRQARFDLVLLDLMMPEMSGYDVLKQIKDDPALRHIPVVMITALSDVSSIARCIELGADDYLTKPCSPAILTARMRSCLEQKRLRDQEQQMLAQLRELVGMVQMAQQTKDEFVQCVIHGLSTPLEAIRASAQQLAGRSDGARSKPTRDALNVIMDNTALLHTLATDLHVVAHSQVTQAAVNLSVVPIKPVLQVAAQTFHEAVRRKQQTITLNVAGDVPTVWGDRQRLLQVVHNLLSNAHKYTPAGGVIELRAERGTRLHHDDSTASVCIAVRDTGVGIEPTDQPQVFGRFARDFEATPQLTPGRGLGLVIAKYLTELQGGRIWFDLFCSVARGQPHRRVLMR